MKWITVSEYDYRNTDALNLVLEGDGTFFISYVEDVEAVEAKFNLAKDSSAPGPETALVRRGTNILGLNEYFILQGDHRQAYEKIIGNGFDACFKYYASQRSGKA